MKNLIFILALAPLISLASNQRSVEDSQALIKVLNEISEIAYNGASLAHFSYAEEFVSKKKNCKAVSHEAVNEYLEKTLINFEADSALIKKFKNQSLTDFAQIIGFKKYSQCDYSITEFMTSTHVTEFIGDDYKIQFQWGYED